MGAQAAALLRSGGPVGDVPGAPAWAGALRLAAPAGFDLARTARAHGGVGLAPTAWDGTALHLRLPDPVLVEPDLTVRWAGVRPNVFVLRRVLALDDDLGPLLAACDRVPSLTWLRPSGAGRVLRSPTVWQDLVGTLAGTRASYRATQAMLRALVGDGPFPTPEQVLDRDVRAFGHRAPWLRALAQRLAGGWDAERLLDAAVPDDQVLAEVRGLAGFGPFATAQLMPLLGRPRPLVLDAWLRDTLDGLPDTALHERYAAMGRWSGTGAWLEAAGSWLRP